MTESIESPGASPSPFKPFLHSLSPGFRSLALLAPLALVAVIAGPIFASSLVGGDESNAVETALRPSLANTYLSADALLDEAPLNVVSGKLKRRQTLIGLATKLGAEHSDANAALSSIYEAGLIDPRKLLPGLETRIWLEGGSLQAIAVKDSSDRRVFSQRNRDGEWQVSELKTKLVPSYQRVRASIETSIYETALQLGAKDQQIVDFASVFAYEVDFQREIHPGDEFEILFETFTDERGRTVRTGNVIYAALHGKAVDRGFYQFTPSDDSVTDYFDSKGESATKFLMKTPINGARLSSHFGRRRHPISGYSRLHKGTDFAARTGTPVYAAGHGTVERASRYGGYGKYVRIRHANGYKTAYAHLSRYGTRKGRRVRQGDVIGYVGSTGASTGPHLHYEVHINGKAVNAQKLKLPTGRKLAETPVIKGYFDQMVSEIDALREQTAQGS